MTIAASPLPASGQAATDDQLTQALRGCAARHVPALTRLYELAAARLLGQLVHMLGDRAEAEDALQECFVRIWQRAASFNPGRGRPWTWLLSIVRHHAIDRLRTRRRTVSLDDLEESLLLSEAAGSEVESAATSVSLQRCMQALGDEQQRCLRLAYVSGQSQDEIARALQLPLGSVKSWIRRGLLALRECMDR